MRILVTVKRIPDPDASLKFTQGTIDTSAVKWVPNAFDEYAVETALRLAEHVGGKDRLAEVVVVAVGPQAQRQHVTQFLAMGADRGIIVDIDELALDAQSVAKLLARVFERESADLLIAGKLSQDTESNEVAQRVAGLLNAPQATFAASVKWDREQRSLDVTREVDDGVETKRIPLPAVVSVDLRVVLPHAVKNGATPATHAYQDGARLASLRGITMAKRKPVAVVTPTELGVTLTQHARFGKIVPPPARASGQRVESPEALIEKLATEAKVL